MSPRTCRCCRNGMEKCIFYLQQIGYTFLIFLVQSPKFIIMRGRGLPNIQLCGVRPQSLASMRTIFQFGIETIRLGTLCHLKITFKYLCISLYQIPKIKYRISNYQYQNINLPNIKTKISKLSIIVTMNLIDKNQTESTFIALVDNLDIKKDTEDDEFIILLKRQTGKDYSTLYLTDCEDNFWLRKIDIKYLEDLKNQLKLKTSTETFIKCLLKSIVQNCLIDFSQQKVKLQLKLQIGEGLTMTCTINLTANIKKSKDENGYAIISKLFLRQLYESKQSKQNSLKRQIQALKQKREQQKKAEVGKKDFKFISQVLNLSQQKKDPNKNLKHRDLMNPNRKKRKPAGIKLTTPN